MNNIKNVYKKYLITEKIRDIKSIKLYIRPPKTVEYIDTSFTVLPTGTLSKKYLERKTIKRTLLIEKIDKDMLDILYIQEKLAAALRIPKRFLNNE